MHVDFNGYSLKRIINYLDINKIDRCWLLTWEETNPGPWSYKPLPIETVYEAFLEYPTRIIPFYAPDPHRSDAALSLENWNKKGIRGCGELKATINWNSSDMIPIFQMLRKYQMPLLFHMEESEYRDIRYSYAFDNRLFHLELDDSKKIYRVPRRVLQILINNFTPLKIRNKSYYFPGYMLDFASLENTLRENPDICLVAHGPMFWIYMSGDVIDSSNLLPKGPVRHEGIIWRLLRQYPNLRADISGASGLNALTRDPENAKRFLSMFENKILFGSDNVIKGRREFLDSLRLSKSTYQKVYGENASNLLAIK